MHGSIPNSEPISTVKLISGKRLAYQLGHIPAHWRVRLALELVTGRVLLDGLTIKQALKLTGASLSQLNEMRRSRAGCSLRELQRRQRADRLVRSELYNGEIPHSTIRGDRLAMIKAELAAANVSDGMVIDRSRRCQ